MISKAEKVMKQSWSRKNEENSLLGWSQRIKKQMDKQSEWTAIDDPMDHEAVLRAAEERLSRHLEKQRNEFFEQMQDMHARENGLREEVVMLNKLLREMEAEKSEENRKLKEQIAKLKDHIVGLEQALKIIGNGE